MEDIDALIETAEVHSMTGGMFFAEVPGMFGIWGHGKTEEESIEALRVNLETYLAQMQIQE